jgi:hypothetical protein
MSDVRERLTEALRKHRIGVRKWSDGYHHTSCMCPEEAAGDAHAAHLADVLLALEDVAVIERPTVAHKGPHDTDAKFFRQVADRMEWDPRSYVGGGNVRAAVSKLLRAVADAAERGEADHG